jgi:hypothetical protein
VLLAEEVRLALVVVVEVVELPVPEEVVQQLMEVLVRLPLPTLEEVQFQQLDPVSLTVKFRLFLRRQGSRCSVGYWLECQLQLETGDRAVETSQ